MTLMEGPVRARRESATVVRPATVGDMIALRTLGAGDRHGTTLVVVSRGWVVGAIDVAALPESDAALVSGLFVRGPHRGRGLARMLVRGACANIVAQGCSWAVAFLAGEDERAHHLFESCGWRPDPRPASPSLATPSPATPSPASPRPVGVRSSPAVAGCGTVAVYRRRVLTRAFAV